jgi:hypothetical protein
MFCWTVRYSLSEGTVLLAGQYGNACVKVRYYLPGSTVMLVGEYGILLRAPTGLEMRAFAGLLSTVVSERDGAAPSEGANLPAGTVFFAGEYGIDLLDGTVLRGRWMGAFLVGEYGIFGPMIVPVRREKSPLGHGSWRGSGGTTSVSCMRLFEEHSLRLARMVIERRRVAWIPTRPWQRSPVT